MSKYLSSSLEGVSGQPGDDLQCLSHLSGARPDHFQNIAQPMQQTSHQVALGEVRSGTESRRETGGRGGGVRSGTESRRETGGRGGEGQVRYREQERDRGERWRGQVRYREQERDRGERWRGSGQVQRAGERQGGEVERVRSGTESRRETGGRGGEGQVRYREQEREAVPEQHLWP